MKGRLLQKLGAHSQRYKQINSQKPTEYLRMLQRAVKAAAVGLQPLAKCRASDLLYSDISAQSGHSPELVLHVYPAVAQVHAKGMPAAWHGYRLHIQPACCTCSSPCRASIEQVVQNTKLKLIFLLAARLRSADLPRRRARLYRASVNGTSCFRVGTDGLATAGRQLR